MALVNKTKLTALKLRLSNKTETKVLGPYEVNNEVKTALDKKLQNATLAKLRTMNTYY